MTGAESVRAVSSRHPPVSVLIAFAILGPLTIHLVLPALPSLQRDFGTDYTTTQLLISAFAVAFGLAQLFVGMLADLFGQRRVLIAGLLLYALASALGLVAWSIGTLVGLRLVQALGVCTGAVIARSLVRSWWGVSDATRILGYLAIGIAIGPMIGPTLGGLVFEQVGWRGLFVGMAGLGLASVALAVSFVPAASGGPGRTRGLRGLRDDIARLLRHRRFRLYWLGVCFNSGVVFTFIVGAPWVGTVYLGLSPTMFGLWFGLGSVGYAGGNYVAGRVAARMRGETVVLTGAVLVAIFVLVMLVGFVAGLRGPVAVFGVYACVMFSTGLLMPNAFAGAMDAVPAASASASGFVGFAQYAVGAVTSSLASSLMDAYQDPVWLAGIMAVSALLCVVAAAALRGERTH